MRTVLGNQFGAEPDAVMYYPDQIEVNTNIRMEEVTLPSGDTEVRWYADSTFYTHAEYTAKQDTEIKLAEDRAVTTAFEATLELLGE